MYNIGVDLGGTNIKVGLVQETDKENDSANGTEFEIIGRANIKTTLPRPAEDIADDIARGIDIACRNANVDFRDVSNVGVGTPGTVDPGRGLVIFSSNLDFNDTPLASILAEKVGRKISLENDASAAAYGELIAGKGRGFMNIMVVTLGTGVGGGIILGGKIYGNHAVGAGEIGHTVIEYGGRQCTCGRNGCWEAYSSATAIITASKNIMWADRKSAMWRICSGDINNVDGKTAFDAMREGDISGRKIVDDYISHLACGLTNMVNIFRPEVIILGGGLSKERNLITDPLSKKVTEEYYTNDRSALFKIETSDLGNDAGIIGASALYRA
ncbi:glucokinase [Clostridia bacterium]|nr:glucokinase [Clostridia bacterium]